MQFIQIDFGHKLGNFLFVNSMDIQDLQLFI